MQDLKIAEKAVMGTLEIGDIITATGGKVACMHATSFYGLSIDSRTIKQGELFIALKGDRFDGHDFLVEALKKGSGALIHLPLKSSVKEKTIISVEDTLKALQDIAHYLRLKREIPVVAVTGSNGKTTTKELTASILHSRYRVLKNTGNLNNHIGLPLSIARISDQDEIVVLEMGASAPGDIRELCEIAVPDYGVLTNISPAHLDGFKNLDTVRKTKLELLDSVGVAVVNADDNFLMEGVHTSGFNGWLVRYGIKNNAELRADDIRLLESGSVFRLRSDEHESIEIRTKLSGMFNIYNILAAASIGYIFNIDFSGIKTAVDSFQGVPMRLEFKEMYDIRFISDVYNANPASMEEAIKELVRSKKGRTIAVLGDMLELGSYAEKAHEKLGRFMSEIDIDIFIAVGPLMGISATGFQRDVYTVKNATEAGRLLKDICKKGDTVLIKGSRAMKMEKVLEEYAL